MENPTKPENHLEACALARGDTPPDNAAGSTKVRAAWRDLNTKGNGSESYRRRLPAGDRQWRWLSEHRLPRGAFYASDRHASVTGDVYCGDLVATYSRTIARGQAPTSASLNQIELIADVADTPADDTRRSPTLRLVSCVYHLRRDGQLEVMLPDGSTMTTQNSDWR